MRFSEFGEVPEPAASVFDAALELVFDEDGMHEHLERLSSEARLVYLVWCFAGEVPQSGLVGFFCSGTGAYCEEILDNLKQLGAMHSREVLLSAMSIFPDGLVPMTQRARIDALDPWMESESTPYPFEVQETDFYKGYKDLIGRMDNYVRSHPDATIGV